MCSWCGGSADSCPTCCLSSGGLDLVACSALPAALRDELLASSSGPVVVDCESDGWANIGPEAPCERFEDADDQLDEWSAERVRIRSQTQNRQSRSTLSLCRHHGRIRCAVSTLTGSWSRSTAGGAIPITRSRYARRLGGYNPLAKLETVSVANV